MFLLTGPATNAITIATVLRTLGKRAMVIYLVTIGAVSLLLGYGLNLITMKYGFTSIIMVHQHDMLPEWLKTGGSLVLIGMLAWYYISTRWVGHKRKAVTMTEKQFKINVEGMSCMHCVGSVKKAVESIEGTKDVAVSLEDKQVVFGVEDEQLVEAAKAAIVTAGFQVQAG